LRDVWIRTQRAALAYRRATNLANHLDFLSIPDPDPTTARKEKRGKQICCLAFFVSHKFQKIENYFVSEPFFVSYKFDKTENYFVSEPFC
jgi:hypothetical protein